MARILLIEDDQQIRDVTTRMLSTAGYKVLAAESGTLGISLWREHDVDLVLTDIQIAGMDGLEVIHEIRSVTPRLPIIVVSGDVMAAAGLRCNPGCLGPVGFLEKPFLRTELLAIVTAALGTEPAGESLLSQRVMSEEQAT